MPEKITHKERTRARILDEAAKALRERGHEAIGVVDVMNRAGLTHGGFYAHFKNRDDLIAATIDRTFEDSRAMIARHFRGGDPAASLSAMIDDYLSDKHRRRVDTGCTVAALSGEAARMPAVARERFEQGLKAFRRVFLEAITDLGLENASEVATSVVAEMVGSLVVARAMSDESIATRILASSREQLKRRLGLLA
jgi:TetR/AcrR family transcriptional repressor of nem operon